MGVVSQQEPLVLVLVVGNLGQSVLLRRAVDVLRHRNFHSVEFIIGVFLSFVNSFEDDLGLVNFGSLHVDRDGVIGFILRHLHPSSHINVDFVALLVVRPVGLFLHGRVLVKGLG